MSTTEQTHHHHDHTHQPGCGHMAVRHEGHVDYPHDGHLHHQEADGTVVEHAIAISATNPDLCTSQPPGSGHDAAHRHGPDCGHEAVPHGDHTDYLVTGRLHHPHLDHCDDHGSLDASANG